MKKKSFLVLSSSFLVFGMVQRPAVNGLDATIGVQEIQIQVTPTQALHELFEAVKLNGHGLYTKKTTIGLNETAVNEMSACFHCNETANKRTTYYAPNKLLLASEDGSIPEGSGSYQYADGEVKRAAALANTNEENMWSNLSELESVGQLEATSLESYYVTVDTFLADGYFNSWSKDDSTGVYYYDLNDQDKSKNEQGEYNCKMWNDFLYFCAPMLYRKSGNYLSAKSLTVTSKYDADGVRYLCLDMYLANGDSGKLNQSYLAEARLYNGNTVFQEDLSIGYFLVNEDGSKIKFDADPNDTSHVMIKDINMNKGAAFKVWDTNGNYHGAASQNFRHNLSASVNASNGFVDENDNYVIPETGVYDLYVNFNNEGTYNDVWVSDKSAKTYYLTINWTDGEGVNYDQLWARYYKDNVELSNDNSKPSLIYSHQNPENQKVYKVTIPGEANQIEFCYHKWSGPYVTTSRTALSSEYNAFYFLDWNNGSPTLATWNYVA